MKKRKEKEGESAPKINPSNGKMDFLMSRSPPPSITESLHTWLRGYGPKMNWLCNVIRGTTASQVDHFSVCNFFRLSS